MPSLREVRTRSPHLTARDLAEVRFATSPLWEIVMSSRVLRDAGRHALHGPWIDEAREALEEGTDLSPLTALADAGRPGRARVLWSLRSPVTTKEVARRLGVTPSAVSQHLSRLHRAGAVERTRVGRRVYYRLSPRGEAVLDAFSEGRFS